MLQVVVRAGQAYDVITPKQPCGEVVGDRTKMLKCFHKLPQSSKVIFHLRQVCQIPFLDLLTAVLRLIDQNRFGLIQKAVGVLKRRPQRCCGLESFGQ